MNPSVGFTPKYPYLVEVGDSFRVLVQGVMLPWEGAPEEYLCRCFLTGDDFEVEGELPSVSLRNTGDHVDAVFWVKALRSEDVEPLDLLVLNPQGMPMASGRLKIQVYSSEGT